MGLVNVTTCWCFVNHCINETSLGKVQIMGQIQVLCLKQCFFYFCDHILPEMMLCIFLALTSYRSSCMSQDRSS